MENLIVIGILLVLVGAAVLYIWKEKKKGTRCIGCPAAGCCKGAEYGKGIDKIGKQISSELSQDKNAERNGVTEPKRKWMQNNETEKDFVRHYIAGGMCVL